MAAKMCKGRKERNVLDETRQRLGLRALLCRFGKALGSVINEP